MCWDVFVSEGLNREKQSVCFYLPECHLSAMTHPQSYKEWPHSSLMEATPETLFKGTELYQGKALTTTHIMTRQPTSQGFYDWWFESDWSHRLDKSTHSSSQRPKKPQRLCHLKPERFCHCVKTPSSLFGCFSPVILRKKYKKITLIRFLG